jgi:hypothetical protein
MYSLREKRARWTSGPDIEIVRNSYRPELKDRPVELPVGTVTRHTLSTSLDVYIRNQPVKLSSNGILGRGGMSYVSPGPGARTLSWDREGMFSNSWRLVQQLPGGGRATVARIEAVRLSLSKIGRFEVGDSRTDDDVPGRNHCYRPCGALREPSEKKGWCSGCGSCRRGRSVNI